MNSQLEPITHSHLMRKAGGLASVLLAAVCLLLLLHALVPAAPAHADDTAFSERREFGASTDPTQSVALGDMDNDGDLDLVVGNDQAHSAVYLNDGVGNFDWPGSAHYFGGSTDQTKGVAVGDADGDGDLDVVTAKTGPDVVYFNDGAANFTLTGTFGTGSATQVAVGDLNGDGHSDIATVGVPNVVYLNDGAGNFPNTAPYTRTFGSGMYTLAMGDVDNDGDLDLIAGDTVFCNPIFCSGGQDIVYLNDGAANFNVTRNFGTGVDSTYSVAMGDIDADGDLDIVSGNGQSSCTFCGGEPNVVYLNDGTGAFTTTSPYTRPFGTGQDDTRSVAVGDVDGDGDLDIVTGNQIVGAFAGTDQGRDVVYLNDGNGDFYSGAVTCGVVVNAICFGDVTTNTAAVTVGDLNGDGALDLAAGHDGQQSAAHLNNGAAQFSVAVNVGPGNDFTWRVSVGDLDSDDDLDLIVSEDFRPDAIYLNDGLGRFPVTRTVGASGLLADLTGDGALDIVGSTLYVNDGAANFPTTRTIGIGVSGVGDLNGDGALDVFGNGVARLNDGTGNFPNTSPYTRTFGAGWNVAGDIDSDGDLDLLTFTSISGVARLNDGAGYFDWPGGTLAFETLGKAGNPALGDMDGDGDLDLLTGNYNRPHALYLNDGRGHFGWPGSAREFGDAWHHTQAMALGDVDGDGDLDVVIGNSGDVSTGWAGCYVGEQSVVYLNDGLGNFNWYGSARNFGTASQATTSVALGDIDGDGDLDIIAGRNSSDPNCVSGDLGGQNMVYRNGLARSIRLPNNPPRVALLQPNPLTNLNFVYANPALRAFTVPVTYTLADPESDPIRSMRAYYSPDGGGRWLPAVAASGTLTTNLATPFLGYGMAFGGVVSDYVEVSPFFSSPTANATVEFWMKSDDLVNEGTPVSYASSGSFNDLIVYNYKDFDIYIAGQSISGSTGVSANDGQWHHIAMTWRSSDGRVQLYKDGVRVFTGTVAVTQTITFGGTLIFGQEQDAGGFQGYQAFNGVLDEVRIWNVERTPAQILANMSRVPPGTSAGLVGYWRFSEGRGNRANDLDSPNDYGARRGGADWVLAAQPHVYNWDLAASGFFGRSDNMAFRIEAYPTPLSTTVGVTGAYRYTNTAPMFQRPYASATTFPFRVRGTQVQVFSETATISNAVSGALVYRLPAGQEEGGAVLADGAGRAFRTDGQGYLPGRGRLDPGDRLLALLPVSATESYTLYHTNGIPTDTGLEAYTVPPGGGVHSLTVSSANPLLLFNLDVSLEWDAHNNPAYLQDLASDLKRASKHLYDFTNGQAALGRVTVHQNADNWLASHVVVQATNRLRPLAAQGGLVLTPTIDPQHNTPTDTIVYDIGQVRMGAVWNRYGTPNPDASSDWAITFAHELAHYLLFLDDTYLGLNDAGLLIPIGDCGGSAMGDVYAADNTEFIYDEDEWNANCANTLANRTLRRTEWETIRLWYPDLITPTALNTGPSLMPFDLTTVVITNPITPTNALADPTFFLEYAGGAVSSAPARAFLLRDENADGQSDYLIDLGNPVGGQNRLLARGATPGDRLCVFDPPRAQYGCEVIESGDERLALEKDDAWTPLIQLTPITSQTLRIQVATLTETLSLQARLYPEYGFGSQVIALSPVGGVYSGTFALPQPVLAGHVQVWADETATEFDPRRELIVAYAIGGNPGRGPFDRGSGPFDRGSGPFDRGSGPFDRGSGAPIVSPDGQMIFFTENPILFQDGELYAVQSIANLPPLPPGRTAIGPGYSLVASPNVTRVLTGSISFQYLGSDVLLAGVDEASLSIYFWNGSVWRALDTVHNPYFNLASAPSQGVGVYALVSSIQIPLTAPGWNLFAYPAAARPVTEALLSISGYYTTVYGHVPTDTLTPWRMYDVTAPPYANDLSALEHNKAYWINVSQAITLYLQGGPASALDVSSALPSPPATFYGAVLPGDGFTPAAGLAVTAWINGVQCGQGRTLEYGGQVMYVVHVLADGPGGVPGCGAPDRTVNFRVGSQSMATTAVWDIRQVWKLALSLTAQNQVYLPVVLKG